MVRAAAIVMVLAALAGGICHGRSQAPPDASFAAIEGEWQGTLVYADYARPGREVTLATRLSIALLDAREAALHFVFDDGPGKVVHSYERWRLAGDAGVFEWISNGAPALAWTVVSDRREGLSRQMVLERDSARGRERQTLVLGPAGLEFGKEELGAEAPPFVRNRYRFTRPSGDRPTGNSR